MAQYLKDYVKGAGAELVTDKERDTTMVQNVLELKKKLDVIHTTAFDKNEVFILFIYSVGVSGWC